MRPLLLLLLWLCVPPAALAESGTAVTRNAPGDRDSSLAPLPADPTRSLLDLINAYRGEAGLSALRPSARLRAIAQAHSAAMVAKGFFAHCDPEGRCLVERLKSAGYAARVWGETIAAGQRDPAAVLRSWQESPPHNAILLNPRVSEAGLGHDPGRLLDYEGAWTLVVAAPR